jgi:hypothetical protein
MKQLAPTEWLGLFAYLGVVSYQAFQKGPLSDDMLMATIPLAAFAILLFTYHEKAIKRTGMGMFLTTLGILLQMASLQTRGIQAGNDQLPLTGLLVLVGMMLLAKSRSLSSGMASLVGWGSLGYLFVIARYFPQPSMLLVLCIGCAFLRTKPTALPPPNARTPAQ